MRKLLLLSVLVPAGLCAQVADDFSDGDFTQNPSWNGDLGHFKVTASSAVPAEQRPALQLDAPEAGISMLSVAQPLKNDLEWRFWAKLSLNTSSGNFARVYLCSDTANLIAPLDGYFLQIGGAADSVIFYRQDSLVATRLFTLPGAFTGNTTNMLRIKATRSMEGNWKFYCDIQGGHSLIFQGETNDFTFPEGDHFGISCHYTSSNTTKFYFDDFYAGPLVVDSVPPALHQVSAVNPQEILLAFSEAVDIESAENPLSYELLPDPVHPYEALRLLDPSTVHLFFDREMEPGTEYTLNVFPVEDLAGNESVPVSVPVLYYRIMPYDLVFTEIMADPSPPRNLPEFEYLEIYNRSGFSLNIEGLGLKISSSEYVLPAYTISPDSYLLLCDDDAAALMQLIAPAIGLSSFNLPNTGAPIELDDASGMTLCFVQYDESWYDDPGKSEGGWSLEMIDTDQPCKTGGNWTASVDAYGGTPGRVNSVAALLEGELRIVNACCVDKQRLLVEFSESLDSLSAADTMRYLVDPFPGRPDSAYPVPPGFTTVRLFFGQEFNEDQVYRMTVMPGLQNCTGTEANPLPEIVFALPKPVEAFDVVINEVLFNPLGDGVDYVELFNRSGKTIALDELVIASVKNAPPELPDTQAVDIVSSCRALFPGHYLVLTTDPGIVKEQYFTENPEAFLELPSFPAYNNDQGTVMLLKKDGTVIDGMNYSEEIHFLMLLSYEGVSLERISPDNPGNDPLNWHSAAETTGFGTPGYQNSQYLEPGHGDETVYLQPGAFSPDGDGRDDNLGIFYHFSSPGKLVSVLIFNRDGRLVRTLVNNEMPGTEGFFTWDGTLDDRTPACDGVYVILMETLGMDGKTSCFKKAGVLARNR